MEIDFVNNKYSEEFIRNYIKENDICHYFWNYISVFQVLSESFIREFQDKMYWFSISHYQKLSENFIREFKDKVYWYLICEHQILSINFIDEMITDGLILLKYINHLLENKKINQEELRSYLSI